MSWQLLMLRQGSARMDRVMLPDTLAWRILDSDGLVQLAGDDALWMEIEP
jgi:hypothetical protein